MPKLDRTKAGNRALGARVGANIARWYNGSGPGRHLRMCPDCKQPADAQFKDHGGQCVKGT